MPVLLIHGDRDRLIPIRAAHHAAAANPSWRFEIATGVGHVPMLEAPVWTAGRLISWLASLHLVPTDHPSTDHPPADQRPTGQPSTDQRPTGQPSTDQSVVPDQLT
jgi:hypothetical protein